MIVARGGVIAHPVGIHLLETNGINRRPPRGAIDLWLFRGAEHLVDDASRRGFVVAPRASAEANPAGIETSADANFEVPIISVLSFLGRHQMHFVAP